MAVGNFIMDENDYCLYVIVRTNLESMNPGKAQAHSGHAANAFIFKYFIDNPTDSDRDHDTREAVRQWMQQTDQGFGTQFNLKAANWVADIHMLDTWAWDNGYAHGMVTDPTYPFEVNEEVFHLLDHSKVEVHSQRNGKYICYRPENTAFYIFGQRSDRKLSDALRTFKRHP